MTPLWCKSNYSFLEGASHPEELVEEAHRLGYRSVAITDRDGVQGAVRAHVKAKELGIHLVLGSQVTVDDGSEILLLVRDREGYTNLCRLVTTGRLRSPKGECSVSWEEVWGHAPGLYGLVGADFCDPPNEAISNGLKEAFGDRLHALIARHERADEIHARSSSSISMCGR